MAIDAPSVHLEPVSVTRQMAAALPRLREEAARRGLVLHHLGAGYPHPEVSDPTAYIAHRDAFMRHEASLAPDPETALRELLTGLYGYTDTHGPLPARRTFARVYGHDFGMELDPDLLVPTTGATGGISLMCAIFERSGRDVAYIVDAPTFAGFISRAGLYRRARLYSVEMDAEGPDPEGLRARIREARRDGREVAFYYTVPDGHNPGGISFSQGRRQAILDVIRQEGTFIVEDAPYTYISYEDPENRPRLFVAMDPAHTVHLFTASKIGLPGPRVAFAYTEARLRIHGGETVALRDLILGESAASALFQNPYTMRGFEAFLTDREFHPRPSMWPVARAKTAVYADNREILLQGLEEGLGDWPDLFGWTRPGAGFFSVFTFARRQVRTDAAFVSRLVSEYGVVTIPMFGFYPPDAHERDPGAGYDQLRLSFCYSEHIGEARRAEMRAAVAAFTEAVRRECGLG